MMDSGITGKITDTTKRSFDSGTLDEPVSDTILRDLKKIGVRIRHVLVPLSTDKELRNWDLWGPLILCLALACTMSFNTTSDEDAALVFTAVFVIVWVGAAVVTINCALLGGNISFFQSVCVLGYCLFPVNMASLSCLFFHNHVFRGVIVLISFLWSVKASVGFMAQLCPEDRKALGVYPVLLFYITLSWMVLAQ